MSRYRVHESMTLSGATLLDNEVLSFLKEIDALERMIQHVGTEEDCAELREAMQSKQFVLSQLVETINTRLSGGAVAPGEEELVEKCRLRFGNGLRAYEFLMQEVADIDAQTQGAPPAFADGPRDDGPTPPRPESGGEEVAYDQLYPAREELGQRFEQQRLEEAVQHRPMPPPPSQEEGARGYGALPPEYNDAYAVGGGEQQEELGEAQQVLVSGVPVQIAGNKDDIFSDLEIDGKRLQARGSVYFDTVEVERRNEEMQQVAQDMVVLQEVFQDAATEIDSQTEELEAAEVQADDAQVNTKSAVNSLGKSSKNAKKIVLPAGGALGGAVAGGITGLVAFGPVGGVVGMGIGAGAGALAGHGTGMVLRRNTNRTMEKARLSEKWQPDKSAKNCTSCGRPFTQTFRKHHCRSCGFIFCRKCTTHKSYLPGIEDKHKVMVCDPCYNRINYGREESSLSAVPIDARASQAPPATAPLEYPEDPPRVGSMARSPSLPRPPSSFASSPQPPSIDRSSRAASQFSAAPSGPPPPVSRHSKPLPPPPAGFTSPGTPPPRPPPPSQ
eukprot:TRINITY_DN6588_c0_g1_i2.p1 TRINITY_DN6588_c0_g1~~TRINITY_DN6588_c0_g1_i2.p1  ORF type:complete len:557 (-),score=168.72 TRINITY_DN6588_c0_g1_i2:184-1854(-)